MGLATRFGRAAGGAGEAALRPLARVSAAARQAGVLAETAHRPWPLPDRPWVMGQTWRNLLFAHWEVDRDELARVVPPQLPIHLHDGRAWVGVTPFGVEGLRLRGTLPPPLVSRFPELNVRTYVEVGGKPGIFFFSLDAASRLAVAAARRSYRLPYFHANMSVAATPAGFRFRSTRLSHDGPPAQFDARYRPAAERFAAAPGSLEHFLAERYCLYTLDERRRIRRADIHHPPWPLQAADAAVEVNSMGAGLGLRLEGEPLAHFSARQDVIIWSIEPVADASY